MPTAVIIDAVRTPVGQRNGALRDWHPVDLAAHTLAALGTRNDLDPALIDDVILGCAMQVDEQAGNVARNAVLAAGFPDSVPGTTVDRDGGSSLQAVHFAAQGVMAGAYDVVVAGGVEHSTRVPVGSSYRGRHPFGPRVTARYELVPPGMAAERVADKWRIDREESDTFAWESCRRAAAAADGGRFDAEIAPVPVEAERGGARELARDEAVRADVTMQSLKELKPAFAPDGGVVTAGNSAAPADGAAAVLITSETRAAQLGLRPRARFHAFAVAADDPVLTLTAPIPATTKVLARAGLALDDVDLVEVNESFAAAVLAWAREHRPDPARVNVNGGAIALGQPLGAAGARCLATLVHELERSGGRYGLQVMAEGGGLANATVIERW